MATATVVFHGLFPDSSGGGHDAGQAVKILYDVEFEGQLLSHEIATVTEISDAENQARSVSHSLPYECPDFEQAVLAYHDYVLEQHGNLISPSGPKGLLPSDNVYRPEWEVRLQMSEKQSG